MTIKVIFLDIDGVLIPVSGGTHKGFNSRNIDNLNELVKKTGAKIVISSDWREKGYDYVQDVLSEVGVNGEIIDITPKFKIIHDEYGEVKVPRGLEIQQWIKKYNTFDGENLDYVLNYVILDDHLNNMMIDQLEHMVEINQTKGFDGKALHDALIILNKETYETTF